MSKPAWPIPLSIQEKIALGELVAILGQIEHLMRLVLDRSTFGPREAGTQSPIHDWVFIHEKTLGPAQETWIKTLRKRLTRADFLERAEELARRIEQHVDDRNHFLHAIYAHFHMREGHPIGILFDVGEHARGIPAPVMVKRTKTGELRPAADLIQARDNAADIASLLRALYDEMVQTDVY